MSQQDPKLAKVFGSFNNEVEGDTLEIRAQNRSNEKMQKQQAERLIYKALDAGVTKDAIGATELSIRDMIDEGFYKKRCAMPSKNIFKHIMQESVIWSKNGEIIFIDGGDLYARMLFGKICLYKGILSSVEKTEDRLGVMINFSELMVRLSNYHSSKFSLLDNLKTIPFLFLYEISKVHTVRENTDAAALFDSIMVSRLDKRNPLIMSFSNDVEDFIDIGANFGTIFSDMVTSIKNQKYFPIEATSITRVRLT